MMGINYVDIFKSIIIAYDEVSLIHNLAQASKIEDGRLDFRWDNVSVPIVWDSGWKSQGMSDEWGMGMNRDEWGLNFIHSCEWEWMGMNNILVLSIDPHSPFIRHAL